jgi:hypothetical protein
MAARTSCCQGVVVIPLIEVEDLALETHVEAQLFQPIGGGAISKSRPHSTRGKEPRAVSTTVSTGPTGAAAAKYTPPLRVIFLKSSGCPKR